MSDYDDMAEQRDVWRARAEKAEAERASLHELWAVEKERAARAVARAEAAEKRAAVYRRYVRHIAGEDGCPALGDDDISCTCGLSALLEPGAAS